MITLDWKERLKVDTEDYVARKLSRGDYDIDIIYNVYPKRVNNNIPSEVVEYVASILASKIAKDCDSYIPFYDYLWNTKGENGKIVFAAIMKTAVKKKPEIFLNYLKKILIDNQNPTEINSLLKKAVFPLLKKDAKIYTDLLFDWMSNDNAELQKGIIAIFIKAAKVDPQALKYIFHKMEREWLYPHENTIKNSVLFLKAAYKIDPDFFFSVYDNYKNSRNPVFVEILCNALSPIKEEEGKEKIVSYVNNWCKSGNIRIKKSAQAGLKVLKVKK